MKNKLIISKKAEQRVDKIKWINDYSRENTLASLLSEVVQRNKQKKELEM